jgi:hypothetical protein
LAESRTTSEVLRVHRRDMTADGMRMKVKGGKWETLLWSLGLRSIVEEAERLPLASKFPASPVFPHGRGRAHTYGGFNNAWQDLKGRTNAALAACDPPMSISDLHVHDVRSTVHDDAEEMGARATSSSATPSAWPTSTTPAGKSAGARCAEL